MIYWEPWKKTQRIPRNISKIQFFNRYFYSRTKIDQILLRLRKCVKLLSLCHTCTRLRQHMWV